MADFRPINPARTQAGARPEAYSIDEGLRAYMLAVYNYMAIGLVITGVVAYLIASMSMTVDPATGAKALTPFGQTLFGTPLKWVIAFAPLIFVFIFAAQVYKMSPATAQVVFWAFAAVMGASLSSIFLVFTQESIVRVFFISAAMFGALSLWGYTTKKDLSGWGTFLFMGLIGVIIASIVNIFLASSALQFAISVIGVLVFAGLTAYDTQQIKEEYYVVSGDETMMGRSAISGALRLYLDFINLFMMLLSLFGNRE
jgi:hypothetical protein